VTSTRLAQQNRSREWAAAPSAATHIPHSPASGNSWHGSDAGSNTTPPDPRSASYETHSRTRVGGWVLRSGCADPVPARSPAQGPRARPKGRLPPPLPGALFPALPSASDCRAEAREFQQALPKPASRFPASLAGWAGRFRPRSSPPSPLGPNPLSTRAVPAAPLSVTRDTRREGTRAPLLVARCELSEHISNPQTLPFAKGSSRKKPERTSRQLFAVQASPSPRARSVHQSNATRLTTACTTTGPPMCVG